ncbi:MAG: hypothetical protein KJZ86_16915 [Caldilineaceae bacterium]|nr:hypothetical protein [Caldilineaceae bacterium]HRJ41976.1 hypothetical protein [Caldilineaceae bacterium]
MALSLQEAVARQPYPDFQKWWKLGSHFVGFMAGAIVAEWEAVQPAGDLARVSGFVDEYTRLVYSRESRPSLADDFTARRHLDGFHSGEFDAISYAFYRDAFEGLTRRETEFLSKTQSLKEARRDFTRRVGKRFFGQLASHLALDLPEKLANADDFTRLQRAIAQTGNFLVKDGYLRDHFAFRFDVAASRGAQSIAQAETDFLPALTSGTAYALYEMGYPIILPSAVYLYRTIGEAQHHSSRTIEELFARCGCTASETADFDPTGYPSELVVELWEIRRG